MPSAREAFIETTARLLETQGYYATGLNQIIAESGAPRGSLYYYFPEGKEALSAEVIERTGRMIEERIQANLALHADPAEAIPAFIRTIARYVEDSGCQGGGPIATVTLETANASMRLRAVCRDAYRSWQRAMQKKLEQGGWHETQSARLATTVIALIEGATILARAEQNSQPLLDVAESVGELLRCSK